MVRVLDRWRGVSDLVGDARHLSPSAQEALRLRAVAALVAGRDREDVAAVFGVSLRGCFRPMFHPEMGCSVAFFGSRQEMVFSWVRRRAMRSVMAMWITASERVGRVS